VCSRCRQPGVETAGEPATADRSGVLSSEVSRSMHRLDDDSAETDPPAPACLDFRWMFGFQQFLALLIAPVYHMQIKENPIENHRDNGYESDDRQELRCCACRGRPKAVLQAPSFRPWRGRGECLPGHKETRGRVQSPLSSRGLDRSETSGTPGSGKPGSSAVSP
jgi:hypothetical protein